MNSDAQIRAACTKPDPFGRRRLVGHHRRARDDAVQVGTLDAAVRRGGDSIVIGIDYQPKCHWWNTARAQVSQRDDQLFCSAQPRRKAALRRFVIHGTLDGFDKLLASVGDVCPRRSRLPKIVNPERRYDRPASRRVVVELHRVAPHGADEPMGQQQDSSIIETGSKLLPAHGAVPDDSPGERGEERGELGPRPGSGSPCTGIRRRDRAANPAAQP